MGPTKMPMPEAHESADDAAEGVRVQIDIPPNSELWVGIEQADGFAPTVILGGNPNGLRMLAAFCTALAAGERGAEADERPGVSVLTAP